MKLVLVPRVAARFLWVFPTSSASHALPVPLAIPLAAAAMYGVGWGLYRIVIFRLVERDLFVSVLATFGLSIVLQQLANLAIGADIRTLDAGFGSLFLPGGLVVPKVKLAAFAVALALGAALMLFLRRSRRGQAIRATAQNARAARVLGVDTDRIYATTFALNAAICGAAGGLVAMTWIIHPYLGLPYTVRAFMIVVVAGLGSMLPVLGAAGGLGIAENYAGFLLGSEYQTAFLYGLLVAILVSRNLMLRRHRGYLR